MGNKNIRTITIGVKISSGITEEIKSVTAALADCLYIHVEEHIIVAFGLTYEL